MNFVKYVKEREIKWIIKLKQVVNYIIDFLSTVRIFVILNTVLITIVRSFNLLIDIL